MPTFPYCYRFGDTEDLPYLRAVILEVMGLQYVAPLAAVRKTMEQANLEGYTIPKDTVVVLNLWNIFHDERYSSTPVHGKQQIPPV